MLLSMRQFAFRLSIAAGRDFYCDPVWRNRTRVDEAQCAGFTAPWTQAFPYTSTRERNIYRTNWRYVGAAVAASLLGVASVLPLYYGWWQLGRAVSLNPLELAQAFRAPLLAGAAPSNATRADLARASGALRVRYAVVAEAAEKDQLLHQGTTMPPAETEPGQGARVEKRVLCFAVDEDSSSSGQPLQRRNISRPASGEAYD